MRKCRVLSRAQLSGRVAMQQLRALGTDMSACTCSCRAHSCTCTTTATADVEHILLPRFVWPCRYDFPAIALNCGSMYRDCIRDESLAR
jgi:hypothetical protein